MCYLFLIFLTIKGLTRKAERMIAPAIRITPNRNRYFYLTHTYQAIKFTVPKVTRNIKLADSTSGPNEPITARTGVRAVMDRIAF